jgi:hypothetical protein
MAVSRSSQLIWGNSPRPLAGVQSPAYQVGIWVLDWIMALSFGSRRRVIFRGAGPYSRKTLY